MNTWASLDGHVHCGVEPRRPFLTFNNVVQYVFAVCVEHFGDSGKVEVHATVIHQTSFDAERSEASQYQTKG